MTTDVLRYPRPALCGAHLKLRRFAGSAELKGLGHPCNRDRTWVPQSQYRLSQGCAIPTWSLIDFGRPMNGLELQP